MVIYFALIVWYGGHVTEVCYGGANKAKVLEKSGRIIKRRIEKERWSKRKIANARKGFEIVEIEI